MAKSLDAVADPSRWRVDANGCHIWQEALSHGYAVAYVGSGRADARVVKVARVLYEREHGPLPEGWVPDHRCEVKACVNVAHLEGVPQYENTRRARGLSPATRAEILRLRQGGMPIRQIAKQVGLRHHSTVSRICRGLARAGGASRKVPEFVADDRRRSDASEAPAVGARQ